MSLRSVAGLVGTGSQRRLEAVPDIQLTGVSMASGSVRPGDLYVGIQGARAHGASFVDAAADLGAVALLTDPAGERLARDAGLPMVIVDDPRSVVGAVSAFVYGEPATAFTLVGVTGTQGKTTTTQLIAAGAAAGGVRTAVVGTMGTWVDGEPVGSMLTTPEAPDLHALFAVMRERRVGLCAMEVSSHALVMGRVDGVVFDLAVFTNLGRDHLDFHRDMDDYFAAKRRLFTPERARRALVNLDDPYGARLAAESEIPTETFSTTGRAADWIAEPELTGSSPELSVYTLIRSHDGSRWHGSVGMAGTFNVANAACAVVACAAAGVDPATAVRGISSAGPVAGRMERLDEGQAFAVIIDYAHKPDALRATLDAVRPVTRGRVVVVLGAGGDRDPGKRPLMGEIAADLADVVVVTDDNPRSEDPATIRSELLAGAFEAGGTAAVVEIGDRAQAIRHAIEAAQPGDTVLIAGKGHETGQEVAGVVHPFDDREVASAVLRDLTGRETGA